MSGVDHATDESHAFLRFLLVGALAACLYALCAAGLASLLPSVPPAVISTLLWFAFIPPVFWCHRRFSFRGMSPRPRALGLYALTQAISSAIVSVASVLFVTKVFWADIGVYLIATALAAIISYLLNRLVVFAPSRNQPHL